MLVEVVEKLKNTEVQAASPAHCYAGPGDVECDFCTGRKHKAIKSCLSELKEEQRKSQQRIQEKQKKVQELKQAANNLKTFQFLCAASGCEDSPSITVNQYPSFYGVRKSLSDMKKRLEEFCEEDFIKIPEQDFCALTLDPNTGHRSLILSEKNRVVTRNEKFQRISNHPERIESYAQVLSKESLCGRCYGEVEWKSEDKVFVSVSYKEINRKGWGNDCMFGHNDQSWSLMCSSSTLSFWHNNSEAVLDVPSSSRIMSNTNMRCEDFNGHVGEGKTGDEEVIGKFGVKERNLEGQMVVDFAKRMDMGVVNTYFQKREEHSVTYKSGGRRTQVDYILCRRGNLKEISDCKVVVGESVARQHRMVVCRMTLMVCKTKRSKIEIEKKTKWWKLKKEECCEEFRQKLRQALGGQVVLPDDWETTAEVIRETGRKVLGVSSGRRKEDKETWWWNEEVQDSIQRKRLAKKKWDMDRTEENRQEYKELQRRVKREVSKAKQKAYDELYTRLDTREGEKDLYRLARQRDRDGKDVQQVRVIKDRDGRVLTSEESVQRRWKEYFEELMNEENEREKRVEGVNSVEQKVDKIRKDEVRKALKRMKSGKAVGPDDIPVEVWKCLGEAAVEFFS
ncbi:hypothetical protein QTP86_033734 [Hemibagrus guttatus]|nr:hypothetical protein QTP86_033734 [Hemibagrus guttatus]